LIATAVRVGSKLSFSDMGNDDLNDIFADEAEKAGALIHRLEIDQNVNLIRLMTKSQNVSF
jgi:hypothetical protein